MDTNSPIFTTIIQAAFGVVSAGITAIGVGLVRLFQRVKRNEIDVELLKENQKKEEDARAKMKETLDRVDKTLSITNAILERERQGK